MTVATKSEPSSQDQTANSEIALGHNGMHLKQHLTKFDPKNIPGFPSLNDFEATTTDSAESDSLFEVCYRQHCLSILSAIGELNFQSIEHVWKDFWSVDLLAINKDYIGNHNKENVVAVKDEENKKDLKPCVIPTERLKVLLRSTCVQEYIKNADHALYQHLVDILLPKVLKPIPNSLTQLIRNFSKNMENWMTAALSNNVPESLRNVKVLLTN